MEIASAGATRHRAALIASIAQNAARRRVPSAARPPTGVGCGSVRQLWGGEIRTADVSSGSASDSHDVELAAAKLTSKLSGRVADLRGRQWPATTGPSRRARNSCRGAPADDRFPATSLKLCSARLGQHPTLVTGSFATTLLDLPVLTASCSEADRDVDSGGLLSRGPAFSAIGSQRTQRPALPVLASRPRGRSRVDLPRRHQQQMAAGRSVAP
jgi:hypothetical protein